MSLTPNGECDVPLKVSIGEAGDLADVDALVWLLCAGDEQSRVLCGVRVLKLHPAGVTPELCHKKCRLQLRPDIHPSSFTRYVLTDQWHLNPTIQAQNYSLLLWPHFKSHCSAVLPVTELWPKIIWIEKRVKPSCNNKYSHCIIILFVLYFLVIFVSIGLDSRQKFEMREGKIAPLSHCMLSWAFQSVACQSPSYYPDERTGQFSIA